MHNIVLHSEHVTNGLCTLMSLFCLYNAPALDVEPNDATILEHPNCFN